MKSIVELNINELKDFLLVIAGARPVFVWGPPGIGKSSVIEQFAQELKMECVPLMGSQIAPEDLIGVPQIVGNVSKFIPPSMIVRDKPFCLFIDELNVASIEVQKAFYSLILDQRIGEYSLPKGSIVIGAGNRAADSSLVKKMPTALVNRLINVHLEVDHRIWLDWALKADIHHYVIEYIKSRPSQLVTKIPPTNEEPFSSPRSWHYVSDGLKMMGEDANPKLIDALLYGSLSADHVMQFKSFIKQIRYKYSVAKIIEGTEKWPDKPEDRDVLLFLVNSAKDYLFKELPKNENDVNAAKKKMVIQIKESMRKLSYIDPEYAQILISSSDDGEQLPKWFLLEITRELPKLIQQSKNEN